MPDRFTVADNSEPELDDDDIDVAARLLELDKANSVELKAILLETEEVMLETATALLDAISFEVETAMLDGLAADPPPDEPPPQPLSDSNNDKTT